MKKLYFLNEEEKERILKLHESATRKQYLSEDMDMAQCNECGKSDMYEYSDLDESDNQEINEVGYFNNWIDVDFQKGTVKLNKYLDCEREGGGSELRLAAGTTFSKKGNELITTNQTAELVGDYMGDTEEELTGVTIRYSCSSKNFSIDGRNAKFFGEDWAGDVQKGFNDLCSQEIGGQGSSGGKSFWDGVKGAVKGAMNAISEKTKQTVLTSQPSWSKYLCMFNHKDATLAKMSNGSYAIKIADSYYYDNGRYKAPDGTMKSYTCPGSSTTSTAPTKTTSTSKSSTPSPVAQSNVKQVQKLVGVAETGIFDDVTAKAVRTKLGV